MIRALYDYWDGKRGGRRMPARPDIDPLEFVPHLPGIMLVDVVADERRFVYRLVGTREVEARGEDPTGKSVVDKYFGSSPVTSILLMLNMACTLFRLTPEEALAGVTRHAAQALGLAASHGTLEIGKTADFCAWDVERPAELAYRIGYNPCSVVVQAGLPIRMADLGR